MVNPIQTTLLYTTNLDRRAIITAKETGITMTDSFADGVAIDNRHLSLTTIAIYNEHASFSLDYSIFGHLDDNVISGVPTQPAFDGTWVEIPKDNCVVTVLAQKSKGETFTENWAWLLIRFKNTTSGNSPTAQVTIRSRQSRY